MNALPEFVSPGATGDRWDASGSVGHLLIVEVHSYETGIETSYGTSDAVKATVHDVDLRETFEDVLIFSGTLVGALKGRVGSKVLANLGLGVAKPGKNAPYVLADATNDRGAIDRAVAYQTARRQAEFAGPSKTSVAAPAAPVAATSVAAPATVTMTTAPAQDPDVVAALAALAAAGYSVKPA